MTHSEPSDKDNFLYPRSSYYGSFTPQNFVFNANLQEFSNRVSIICSLETAGKLSADEAYHQIKALWKQLERSNKELGINKESPSDTD